MQKFMENLLKFDEILTKFVKNLTKFCENALLQLGEKVQAILAQVHPQSHLVLIVDCNHGGTLLKATSCAY